MTYITIDLLNEFIEDAKAKDDLDAECEINHFRPNHPIKKSEFIGRVKLNTPDKGYITIDEEKSDQIIVISPQEKNIKLDGHYIPATDEICLLEIHNSKSEKIRYLGIICDIVIGLDHGVTISVDINGTDWTGYLGRIIY